MSPGRLLRSSARVAAVLDDELLTATEDVAAELAVDPGEGEPEEPLTAESAAPPVAPWEQAGLFDAESEVESPTESVLDLEPVEEEEEEEEEELFDEAPPNSMRRTRKKKRKTTMRKKTTS